MSEVDNNSSLIFGLLNLNSNYIPNITEKTRYENDGYSVSFPLYIKSSIPIEIEIGNELFTICPGEHFFPFNIVFQRVFIESNITDDTEIYYNCKSSDEYMSMIYYLATKSPFCIESIKNKKTADVITVFDYGTFKSVNVSELNDSNVEIKITNGGFKDNEWFNVKCAKRSTNKSYDTLSNELTEYKSIINKLEEINAAQLITWRELQFTNDLYNEMLASIKT